MNRRATFIDAHGYIAGARRGLAVIFALEFLAAAVLVYLIAAH